jgi:predicted DNA-binding transcriptional regulator YafY
MQLVINNKYDRSLKELAEKFGFTWGENPSVTALIEAIASREITISAMPQIDSPHYPKIKELIERKQSFRVYYLDPVGNEFLFTAQYAEISQHEGKPYLNIWFAEEREDFDLIELRHNRTLRIDRIQPDAAIEEIDLPWRDRGLDTIDVTFDLFGNLAFTYSKKEADVTEWIGDKRIRITRKVSNLFWWQRKILQYTPNIKVISPQEVAFSYADILEKGLMSQSSLEKSDS